MPATDVSDNGDFVRHRGRTATQLFSSTEGS